MNKNKLCLFVAAGMSLLGLPSIQAQTVRDVVSFEPSISSGEPGPTPTQGRDGKLYGTFPDPEGASGADFSLTASGKWQIIHAFSTNPGGVAPFAGFTLASDGNLYGSAGGGGSANWGLLYRLDSSGNYTILHNFLGGSDGSSPLSPPIEGTDGNFYGVTAGNAGNPATVYKYDPSSGTLTTIYLFDAFHGMNVAATLLQASDGYLYGVAGSGGSHDYGTIFKLDTSGKLFFHYSFPGGVGGRAPSGPLIEATDGNVYGATGLGGSAPQAGDGMVFKMTKAGSVSMLFSFNRDTTGLDPGGIIQGTDGYLYGAFYTSKRNQSGLYRISLSGQYESLYLFPTTVGSAVSAPLMQDTNGLFYGSSFLGGAYSFGAIYSLDMGLPPFVAFVQPVGKAGQSAQILGQNLTGATSVTFNGIPATKFKVVSDTYMTAVVPSGATTGPVVVTTPTGPLTSNVSFRISK